MRPCARGLPGPAFKQGLRRDGFDLLAEAVHIDIHHGVVGFVRRTAKRIRDKDDAEAPVDRAQHGGQHADIGFAAGDDDGVDPGAAQLLVEVAPGPGRVDVFVEGAGRGNELREVRDQPDHFRAELVDGHGAPSLVIMPPHADALAGPSGPG